LNHHRALTHSLSLFDLAIYFQLGVLLWELGQARPVSETDFLQKKQLPIPDEWPTGYANAIKLCMRQEIGADIEMDTICTMLEKLAIGAVASPSRMSPN